MMRIASLYSKFIRPLCGAVLLLVAGCADSNTVSIDTNGVAIQPKGTELPISDFSEKKLLIREAERERLDALWRTHQGSKTEVRRPSFELGKPLGKYVSKPLKSTYEIYFDEIVNDKEFTLGETLLYEPILRRDDAVCEVAELTMFSDQMNVSEFYVYNPAPQNTETVKVEKIDSLTYYIKHQDRAPVFFHFEEQEDYSEMLLCSSKVKPPKTIVIEKNADIRARTRDGELSCQGESKITLTDGFLSRHTPHQISGFFIHNDEIYLNSIKITKDRATSSGHPAKRVATIKLTYKTVSGTADLAFLNIFRELPICVYIQDRYVEWEKQLIEKSGLEYQR